MWRASEGHATEQTFNVTLSNCSARFFIRRFSQIINRSRTKHSFGKLRTQSERRPAQRAVVEECDSRRESASFDYARNCAALRSGCFRDLLIITDCKNESAEICVICGFNGAYTNASLQLCFTSSYAAGSMA